MPEHAGEVFCSCNFERASASAGHRLGIQDHRAILCKHTPCEKTHREPAIRRANNLALRYEFQFQMPLVLEIVLNALMNFDQSARPQSLRFKPSNRWSIGELKHWLPPLASVASSTRSSLWNASNYEIRLLVLIKDRRIAATDV